MKMPFFMLPQLCTHRKIRSKYLAHTHHLNFTSRIYDTGFVLMPASFYMELTENVPLKDFVSRIYSQRPVPKVSQSNSYREEPSLKELEIPTAFVCFAFAFICYPLCFKGKKKKHTKHSHSLIKAAFQVMKIFQNIWTLLIDVFLK